MYFEKVIMIKAKMWNGESLSGLWAFTIKIDGVRGLYRDGQWFSRANKPLYNIPTPPVGVTDAEIFCGSFKHTIEVTRSHQPQDIERTCIYSIDPIDFRLEYGSKLNPEKALIWRTLDIVRKQGNEGLILRQDNIWLKVKPEETHDVLITNIIEGKGRNAGRMGAVRTPMGKVGIGFTDIERQLVWDNQQHYLDSMIEVSCMQLTADGKFRHPRFVRFRSDK